MSDVILEAQLDFSKAEQQAKKAVRKINNMAKGVKVGDFTDLSAINKFNRGLDKIRKANAQKEAAQAKKTEAFVTRIKKSAVKRRAAIERQAMIEGNQIRIGELRKMLRKADAEESKSIQRSIAAQKRKTRAIIAEIKKQALAADQLAFEGQIVPGVRGRGRSRRTPPSLSRSDAARRSGGEPSKFGSRATGIAFQLQQTVEDFSFAGFRGASNNLALIASQMQHTTKQGTMLNKVLGAGGFVAIAGLAVGAMVPMIRSFFDWATGAKEAREKQKELSEQARATADAIEHASSAIEDQLEILKKPLLLPTDKAVKQINELQKALQRVINTGGKDGLIGKIAGSFSGSEKFAKLTELLKGDFGKPIDVNRPRNKVRSDVLDAFGVGGGPFDDLSGLGMDPNAPKVPKSLKDVLSLSDVGKTVSSLEKKIRNLRIKRDALLDAGGEHTIEERAKVGAEIKSAKLRLSEILIQVFNDPKVRKAISAQALHRAMSNKDDFAKLQKAIGVDKMKKVQEAMNVQKAIDKSPTGSDIISGLQGKNNKVAQFQNQLKDLKEKFNQDVKQVTTLKQLNDLQEKFKRDAGVIVEKIKMQELQEKAAAEAKRNHLKALRDQVSEQEKIVRLKQREIDKQNQIISSARKSQRSEFDSFSDGAFGAAGDFGKASVNVAAARKKAAIRRRFPGLKFLGPDQMVLKNIDAQIDRQANVQQEVVRRNLLERQGGFLSSQAASAGKGGDKDRQINLLKKLQGLQLQESSKAAGQGNLGRSKAAFEAAKRTQAQIQSLLQNQVNAAQKAIQAAQQQKNAAQKNANSASNQLKAAMRQKSAANQFANAVAQFNAKVQKGPIMGAGGAGGAAPKAMGGLGVAPVQGALAGAANQAGPIGAFMPGVMANGIQVQPAAPGFGGIAAVNNGVAAGAAQNINNINIAGNANQADIFNALGQGARNAFLRAGTAIGNIFGF